MAQLETLNIGEMKENIKKGKLYKFNICSMNSSLTNFTIETFNMYFFSAL